MSSVNNYPARLFAGMAFFALLGLAGAISFQGAGRDGGPVVWLAAVLMAGLGGALGWRRALQEEMPGATSARDFRPPWLWILAGSMVPLTLSRTEFDPEVGIWVVAMYFLGFPVGFLFGALRRGITRRTRIGA